MSDFLPQDAFFEILALLPVKTLLRFRCVSKPWCSLISSPGFITHHLNKVSTRSNDLLFFQDADCCFLYPEKGFPNKCGGEELYYPPKELDLKCSRTLVGSCNGVFCICDVYFSNPTGYIERAILWNPRIRKIVPVQEPSVPLETCEKIEHCFGFGFDSIHNDYKLVRIVYFLRYYYYTVFAIEVYSLTRGCWRTVNQELKYVIKQDSTSAFVNGACHWAVKGNDRSSAPKVIVFFNFADEKIGEITVPDCVHFGDGMYMMKVIVFDGLLSVVALLERSNWLPERARCSIWTMKQYGDAQSWTKLFNIEHSKVEANGIFFIKKNGEMFLNDWVRGGELTSYRTTKNGSCKICGTGMRVSSDASLDLYVESLVLLSEPGCCTSVDNSSTLVDNSSDIESDTESNGDSSHVAALDKEKKKQKKKGKKDTETPEIVNEDNGSSKDSGFGVKNRKQKEKKKKKWKDETESLGEFPGKHPFDQNGTCETTKEPSSSSSRAAQKKGKEKREE